MSEREQSSRLDALEARLSLLEQEIQKVRAELVSLRSLEISPPQSEAPLETHTVSRSSSPAEKIELFLQRFHGRRDVFATSWVSRDRQRKGWSPATRSGFYSKDSSLRDLLPLNSHEVERHLSGHRHPENRSTHPYHIGVYPMLPNDRCSFLACDFDDGNWQSNASAFAQACKERGLECLAEVSRSGEGAHVWMFFDEPVPAAVARRAGFTLLREAMDSDPSISFDSYDRFFPAQDSLPAKSPGRGSFGNLIALPMQGDYRRQGKTLFCNPQTWEPLKDQWAALATVSTISTEQLRAIAVQAGVSAPESSEASQHLERSRATRSKVVRDLRNSAVTKIDLHQTNGLELEIAGLPGSFINYLKHEASVFNPEFYRRQAQRFSTFGIPRLITRFHVKHDVLYLPRGLRPLIADLCADAGVELCISDVFPQRKKRIHAKFVGKLRPEQKQVVRAVTQNPNGIIVAPPGFGKTVVACALIAKVNQPTAILVNRKELLDQWSRRITEFLDCPFEVGKQGGGGKSKRSGKIDIIMMQSLARKTSDPEILNQYGLVIVDECHNAASPAVEAALSAAAVENWVGLTATPYRSDQLGDLITMLIGPIIVDKRETPSDTQQRLFYVHPTKFSTDTNVSGAGGITEVYNELAHDSDRNALIVREIEKALAANRTCLVLSNRVEHVINLATSLESQSAPVFALHGKLPPAERSELLARVRELATNGQPFALVAMDAIVGEGFDLPGLDTLFFTMPIAFKGRIIQQAGRITRGDAKPIPIELHDFLDAAVPQLDRMFRKRRRVLLSEGFVQSP